ncbi:MAG TPA: hypothetical protein VFD84_08955 [Candidatus Binatia bacterium]|nr:hypothetical protein [Candidatus Binatia bacterium]
MRGTLAGVVGVALLTGAACIAADSPIVASLEAVAANDEGPCPPDRESAAPPAAPPQAAPSPLRLRGQKVTGPQLQRSEAGFSWSLGPKLTLEFDYERSGLAPMMSRDHDDGFLTRFKIGF